MHHLDWAVGLQVKEYFVAGLPTDFKQKLRLPEVRIQFGDHP